MHTSTMDARGARRRGRIWRATAIGIVAALSLTATAAISTTAGAQSSSKILGTKNVAKGEPVKIGIVTNGRSANLDNEFENTAAKAITAYLNEYKGGIGGRPIELHLCTINSQANATKSQECANQLINEGVVMIITGSFDGVSPVHTATAAAKVPYFLYSITDPAVTTDPNYTFAMFDPNTGVYALPISVAKDNKLKLVNAVVIDVPAGTELYTSTAGKQQFADAKLDMKLTAIPIGQADVTPQMAAIANGQPSEVQIIGNDTVCIAAFKGLQANAFDGPISTLYTCVNEATRQAVGSYLEGVYISVSTPLGDTKSADYKLMDAIYKKYATGDIDRDKSQNLFATYMSAWQPIAKMKGDVTTATVNSTIKAMDNMKSIGAGGLIYRCNGKAKPELVAVCTPGGLRTTLDATGKPTLPYKLVGNGPVPN